MTASLRDRRMALGMTQLELAVAIGCTPRTVSTWETTGNIKLRYRARLEDLEKETHPRPPGRPRSAYKRMSDSEWRSHGHKLPVAFRQPTDDLRDVVGALWERPQQADTPWFERHRSEKFDPRPHYLYVRATDGGEAQLVAVLHEPGGVLRQPALSDLALEPRRIFPDASTSAAIDAYENHARQQAESD